MLLSTVTSTCDSALAASLSKAAGILMSCAHAEVSMTATNTIAILMILLSLPWSVTDALNPRLHQPELAAGDSQRQHHLLLGPFSLRPSLPLVAILHCPDDQRRRGQRGRPAQARPPERGQPAGPHAHRPPLSFRSPPAPPTNAAAASAVAQRKRGRRNAASKPAQTPTRSGRA